VATDGSGDVYVADTLNHRVQKFDGSGTLVTTWGTYGSGNGQFVNPQGVATDGIGNAFTDEGNNRIRSSRAHRVSARRAPSGPVPRCSADWPAMRVRPASAREQVPGQRDGPGIPDRSARRLGEVPRKRTGYRRPAYALRFQSYWF